MMLETSHELVPGDILAERYRIDVALATGGQAHVYRARQLELEREVAIKVLRNHGSAEVRSRMIKRFEQEARLISKLKDSHTITLYDFGKLRDGALFMVFEYVDGVSLKELLAAGGPVAPYRVAKILKQTLSSLHEAHSFGVLHRDIKPANIMIYEHAGRADLVKLLDFGIAKIVEGDSGLQASEPNLTGDRIVGTPRYIAPELLLKSAPTPASDLYSLGLVGYELLVGRPAITARGALEIAGKQITAKSFALPDDLSVDPELRRIIDKLTRKPLPERYVEAREVAWDLKRWMQRSVPPAMRDSEAFEEDLTPADEIDAIRDFKARARTKSGLHVLMPEPASALDMTPRTAFTRSVVFEGRPSVERVSELIAHATQGRPAVTPNQLDSSALGAPALGAPHPLISPSDYGRGGDTIAVVTLSKPASRRALRRRQIDEPKMALVVIVALILLVLAVSAALAVALWLG